MVLPDFEAARTYALRRLDRELPPNIFYHSLAHTRDDVVPAARRLARLAGVAGTSLLLLLTAAYFHDIGFIETHDGHELISIQIAAEHLPRFGYSGPQVDAIAGMILATRLPQSPRTALESLLADADLDTLGRADFWSRNQALRDERAAAGKFFGDVEWYSSQLAFLRAHVYWTAAARSLRDSLKARNIAQIELLLEEAISAQEPVAGDVRPLDFV